MEAKRFLCVPVLAVLLLMLFVYYNTIFVFIDDWVGLKSSPGTLNAAIFTLLASLCLFSFFVCVLTDPGHVPSSYLPDVEHSSKDSSLFDLLPSSSTNLPQSSDGKNCDKCFAYKPPRTHHCRVCRRCVLKMDHHCLWINNCVGYWNYKAFVVLIIYASMASIHSTILFLSCVFQKDWGHIKGSSPKLFYVMYGMMVMPLTGTLLTLSGWHVYLILHNMTTIEFYEGKRAKWLAMKSGQSYRHPFNIGAYKNITSILGPNMLKWLCPTAVSHLKDGVSFPTPRDSS